MAQAFAQGVRSAGGNTTTLFLRTYNTLPCSACYACRDHPQGQCIFTKQDDTDRLYTTLRTAPLIFLTAPIFFYHLPAQLKAFIDRAHASWIAQEKNPKTKKRTRKPAFVGLVAGKAQGDKLFEGSLLTLRYFFHALDMHIHSTHLLRACDAKGDFLTHASAYEYSHALGMAAQKLLDSQE